ncbi:hypothetical protein EDEG_01053 [Edhazardia aedis USNM 41457]|uniref:Uncharacterized protein n=1 Tax=Edhazardia aedis (strain USNM 41457) TaxID=1003232 RepID=J8ZYL4_EDHAE|nr:hypothetical protein EDEG_01053 [Edhazardia aedis USNM 41457]|eukprot:EJW04763.1 hypothetical protein EDEG_01053 [Edhazardia aedis USNM 41457]
MPMRGSIKLFLSAQKTNTIIFVYFSTIFFNFIFFCYKPASLMISSTVKRDFYICSIMSKIRTKFLCYNIAFLYKIENPVIHIESFFITHGKKFLYSSELFGNIHKIHF